MLTVQIRKQLRSPGSPVFQLQVAEEFDSGFTVLFGASGAGKSTLLDCIAGLLAPDAGTIKLRDEVFLDAERKCHLPPQKRRVAYVFQSLALFPHLSAEENVAYGLSGVEGQKRGERVESILQAFQIEKLRRRKPAELSGGEKQRVALARSLVTEPRVLLLDEPLTGLDAALRRSILQDLREWNEGRRIPILYVTHNREEVDAVGERVVVMADGKVRERGMPRAVLHAPKTVALAQAAGFENLLAARVSELRPDDGVMRVALDSKSCELEIPYGSAQLGETVQVAIGAGDILLASAQPHGLSARNILPGTVESLETRGTMVVVQVDAGVRFAVHVTLGAARSMDLARGLHIWLVIKTHSCHVVSN